MRVSFQTPHASPPRPPPLGPLGSHHEYPTTIGPFRMRTLARLVHAYGFRKSVGGSVAMDAWLSHSGPSSVKRPYDEGAPGPPLVHRITGAVVGSATSAVVKM